MTDRELHPIAKGLLNQGFTPRDIRRQFQARNIRWNYEYSGRRPDGRRAVHQGARECLRRMKQANLCMNACGRPRHGAAEMCESCLREKWGGTAGPHVP